MNDGGGVGPFAYEKEGSLETSKLCVKGSLETSKLCGKGSLDLSKLYVQVSLDLSKLCGVEEEKLSRI